MLFIWTVLVNLQLILNANVPSFQCKTPVLRDYYAYSTLAAKPDI